MNDLRGTGVALITPFTSDNKVDFEGLGKLLHFTVSEGIDYLVVNGTTAESATTTLAEKKEILAFIKQQVKRKVPIVYGAGGNCTEDMVQSFSQIDFEGISAILSVSPYYNKPTQEGLYQHYLRIADACPVPVILYNVPGRTASNISAETTLRLASHPNIIGTKEASGNLEQCMVIAKHKPADFLLISGDDMLALPMLTFGAVGVISVLANAFPGKFSRMVKLGRENKFAEASEILFQLLDLNPLMYEEGNPVGIKTILERMEICGPAVRLPLVPASINLKEKIYKLL
ncbi:MAG: dihydrodipicolinate synthase [Adhaeribacter sp.]|jgi:4-hydroxy-tetrahydrodipicolinate synthase|nr:dihydrodipicolinate synthase [Adhaeribacter sp.]